MLPVRYELNVYIRIGRNKVLNGSLSVILMIQDYWIFGPYPSPDILKTREHNVSETGSVLFLR
jgi:hypothetical protein